MSTTETGKPKLLFLDDRTKRIHAALEQYSGKYEVTIVTNVLECLRYLAREDWEIVSLDHDLNGCDFEDPDVPTCGMEVVRYLEKTGWPPCKKKPTFKIHSSNLFAAYLMETRLQRMGFATFYEPPPHGNSVEPMKYDRKGNPK